MKDEPYLTTWRDATDESPGQPITALVAIEPVTAIVITQNCDAARAKYISLATIDDYLEATGKVKSQPRTPKKWADHITRSSRESLRLFYLPADPSIGLPARMAVDFCNIIRIPRLDLESMRDRRIAKLKHVATEHFRETLAQFFRRYPYNEWYPLNKEEFEAYAEHSPAAVEPYDWQK